jgi:RecA/RadA recombinase
MKKINEILNIDRHHLTNLESILNKKETKMAFIPSGSSNLNKVLGGGFQKGQVYVFFGPNRTGKTQLCHQMCTQLFKYSASMEKEENKMHALYYDTENTFRTERIEQMSTLRQLNPEKVLNNILVSKIMSNSALLISLKDAEKKIINHPIKMCIVDSINNYYRVEKGMSKSSFAKARDTFLKILGRIYHLTSKYKLIMILTAQITPNFIENAIIDNFPVGLQYLNHFFSEMFYLTKKDDADTDKNLCFIHLVNSTSLPEKKLLCEISAKGLQDYRF